MDDRGLARSIAFTAAVVVVAVVALLVGRELSLYRETSAPTGVAVPGATTSATPTRHVTLPQPIPQPITRTSAASQIAWVQTIVQEQSAPVLVGTDPAGRIVGRIDVARDPGRSYRSADGTLVIVVADDHITAYSALDGSKGRTYSRQPAGGVIDVAFSLDGHWVALIGSQAYVQVIDLGSGVTQTTPLAYDPKAATPGMSGTFTGPIWSTLVFAPDSRRLYTLVDWGGPLRLTAFDVTPTGLVQAATARTGEGVRHLPSCGGPGLAPRVLPDGKTLVAFCHYDGNVWFIDLPSLTAIADVPSGQTNPFELSPIFTPDGQLLYLRGGTNVRVADLRSRAVIGPAPIPRKVDESGPFSWLFAQASAGYIASTVPISPDGTKLYLSGGDGISVLRLPDLKPIATLGAGLSLGEVWISGDGKTVYATDAGHGLYVMPENGGAPIVVTLPGQYGGYFIASEHG